jgi:hypothetical protein
MSRKDYEAVAEIFCYALDEVESTDISPEGVLRMMADRMAQLFKSDNPAFNRDRFMDAIAFVK